MKQFIILIIIGLALPIMSLAQGRNNNVTIQTSAVCGMCKKKIEANLSKQKGIYKVNLDIKTKGVMVTFDHTTISTEKIREIISKTGYDADEIPADPKAYAKLHLCCKKTSHQPAKTQ